MLNNIQHVSVFSRSCWITKSLNEFKTDQMETKKKTTGTGKLVVAGILGIAGVVAAKAVIRSVNRYNLENKVVLITGGTRGLGLILARKLVEENAWVVVCARNPEELAAVASEFSSKTDQFLAVQCDVTDQAQVDRMIGEAEQKLGPVNVVINNAGVIGVGPMETMTQEDYEAAMKVHFWGPFYVINRVLPTMKKQRSGRIVNIVSIGGLLSFPHLLPYNVSKFALSGYSEGLAAEVARNNIRVTTVYPGLMATGSPRNIDVKGDYKKEYNWFSASASLPGIAMDAEKAATRIISALRYGEKSVTLSVPAKIGSFAHYLFPGYVISLFGLINRLLPNYTGNGQEARKAHEVIAATAFNQRAYEAEIKYNQQ